MKDHLKSTLLVELTAQEAAAINGGRHGADDGPGHHRGEDHHHRGEHHRHHGEHHHHHHGGGHS